MTHDDHPSRPGRVRSWERKGSQAVIYDPTKEDDCLSVQKLEDLKDTQYITVDDPLPKHSNRVNIYVGAGSKGTRNLIASIRLDSLGMSYNLQRRLGRITSLCVLGSLPSTNGDGLHTTISIRH